MTEPDEARIAWNACAAARFEDEENGNPLGLPQGMPNFDDFKDGYRAGAAASEARIKALEARVAELEAALAKANEPHWYYSDEEGSPWWSLEEALEQVTDDIRDVYHGDDMPSNHLVEIDTSRACPTIWGVVRLLTEDEAAVRGCKDRWVFTPCATEAEARALLKEADQ